jgi:hypothetical protein
MQADQGLPIPIQLGFLSLQWAIDLDRCRRAHEPATRVLAKARLTRKHRHRPVAEPPFDLRKRGVSNLKWEEGTMNARGSHAVARFTL